MPARPFRLTSAMFIAVAGMVAGPFAMSSAAEPPVSEAEEAAPQAAIQPTAADFLESVGQRARARWRLQFRPGPPTPPTDRGRAALILGTLLGDSFLIWQAGDAQQFRNNNQDVLSYCRTLGLGEKLLPRLMTQGNLAEQNGWKELRREIVDGHQEAMRLLREQMDEDLALLIDVGVGLRLFEIASSVITAAPEVTPVLFEGSPDLLNGLREDLSRLSAAKRAEPFVQRVRGVVDDSLVLWQDAEKNALSQEQLDKTNATMSALMQGMLEK